MLIKRVLMVLILLQCVQEAMAHGAERPVVREVVTTAAGNGARIEVRADRPLTYRSYLMPELAKWVVDLPGALSAAGEDQSRRMRTRPIERISVKQREINGDPLTRIGIDVTGPVEFSLAPDPADAGRLVILIKPVPTR